MNIVLDNYTPLISYLSPASIPQIVAHIQDYLLKHPILSVETVAEIIVQSLQEHPELLNGEAIPISADSEQSIKAYIDALPFLDTYTKAEINQLLLGKQDTLTFDEAPTPGSSNPVTSSGIIAAMSALQSALETQISAKADRASTYTKTQVDTLLEDKADADNVYSKNTIDAKLLEVDTEIDNVNDALDEQSQQIDEKADIPVTVTVTVDANGAAISAEDKAKLTADMVMCSYRGDRNKLITDIAITPNGASTTAAGKAVSQTVFTVSFIHSDGQGGTSVIYKNPCVLWEGPRFTSGSLTIDGLSTCTILQAIMSGGNGSLLMFVDTAAELVSGISGATSYGADTKTGFTASYAISGNTLSINSERRGLTNGTTSNYSGLNIGIVSITKLL